MPTKYLKKGNIPTLVLYLIWNIAIFLVVSNGTTDFWDNIRQRVSQLKARDSLFYILTPLILTIACGLLPSPLKDVLVFWKIKNALPGCRAFTKLAKNDKRIDESRLKKKLGKIPKSPRDENTTWYQWYKKVQNEITIQESHKQFLLNRDLTGISFLFLLFGTPAFLLTGASGSNTGVYAGIMALQYVIFSIVARNHGNRFICNVMVEYLGSAKN